ncbi:proteasome accessory factor PafA2, partial [Rhodococcus hoagii]|nr:proteasome accessory factor PafA2 [Prescottella equi]
GNLVGRHGDRVAGAAWETLLLRGAGERVHRLHLAEPLVGAAVDLPGWWEDAAAPRPDDEALVATLAPLFGARA